MRKAEKLVLNRARSINQAVIAQWYEKLAAKLESLGITDEPMNIHYCDEGEISPTRPGTPKKFLDPGPARHKSSSI